MANYCTTYYVVEGKRETLEKIKDVINTVAKRYTEEGSDSLNLSGVLIALGLYTEESLREATKDFNDDTPENLGVRGDWFDAEVKEVNGNVVLTFTEEYKWNCSCNMENLAKLAPWSDDITAVYRHSEEPNCDIDETTDAEGKYFPKGIKIASGLSAGDLRKIAQQIVKEQFGEIKNVYRKTDIMKTFQFPAGMSHISKKELKEVFSKYERVEIPGTVVRINARFDNDESSRFIVKELVLNEGVQSLLLFANKSFTVNLPKSMLEIETNALLPRVLCLPENFIRLNWGINGVEYLQAYGESEVRYCFDKNSKIKHYVLLGQKLTPNKRLFDDIPAGCVIHVESEKMAEKVLNRGGFDTTNVYVIADALEWKDFPAEKLALTKEKYDPESRILPLQKEMREEKLREKAEEKRKEQEEKRQKQKEKLVASMTKPIIKAALQPLCDSWNITKVDNIEKVTVSVSLNAIKWFDYKDFNHKETTVGTRLELSFSTDNIAENAQKIAKVLSELKDFFQRYAGDMERMKMRMHESTNPWMEIDLKVFLATRCNGKTIIATVDRDSVAEDSKAFAAFAEELDSIITHARYDERINVEIGTKW